MLLSVDFAYTTSASIFVLLNAVNEMSVISDIQLMKKGLNLIPKKKIYQNVLVSQWSLLCILFVLSWLLDFRFKHLFYYEGVKASLFMKNSEMLVGAITGGVIAVVLLPLFMKLKKMAAAFEKIDFMLPKTLKQRITFFFIAVTAGVCEEIIFRGAVTYFFMYQYG